MATITAYLIIFFGVINAVRMTSYFILGDLYDCLFARKKINNYFHPLISIVIAAHNEEKVIERTLRSIYDNSYKYIRVIVVNDGSTDETSLTVLKFKKKYKIKNLYLLHQRNKGKAHALNYGIKKLAKGCLIMTLDADSLLHRHALKNVLSYFLDKKVVAVASNVKIIKTTTFLGIIQYIEYLLGHRLKKAYTVLNNEYIIGGIGSTFRKEAIKRVNYYDTNTITEDIDLTMKLLSMGNKKNKVIYASNVICYTESVPTLGQLYQQRLRWKYGRFQTLYKNLKMFFNPLKKYTKLLTFFQLPFVIYSEIAFLLDPLLIFFIVYISVKYTDMTSFFAIFSFLAFYVVLTIISDEHLNIKEKFYYVVLSPLSYFFFLIISMVEYCTLIISIIKYKQIIKAVQINKCDWAHVDRIGTNQSGW